jgi:2'-5' RNA ligase
VRLFLAINLPSDVRLEVWAATASLRSDAPELAWIGEPRLHFTLKFFGDLPTERVEALQATISGVAGRHRESLLSLGEIGAFPNFRRARVVWIGVEPDPRLELLHHDVEIACAALGYEIEGRPFRPHLTLARIKTPLPNDRVRQLARAAKQIDFRTEFIVRSIDLMQSTLTAAGPTYTTLVSAALRSD